MSVSPVSGALFMVTATVHYDWQAPGDTSPVLFPHVREDDAERMAKYLASGIPKATYSDIRIAHCSYSELPEMDADYNNIDPLF